MSVWAIDNTSPKPKIEYKCPITYFEENMYFTPDKKCWAAYKVTGFTYDFRAKDEKFSLHDSLTKLFWNLKNDGHIRIIPRISSIREGNEALKKRAIGQLKMQAIMDIEAVTNDLVQLLGDEGNEYDTYICVRLEDPKSFFATTKEFIHSLYADPIRKINEIMGLDSPEIFLREIEAFKRNEELIHNRVNRYLKVERASEDEIQRMMRHPFYFGFGEPPLRGGKSDNADRLRKKADKVWKPYGEIVIRNGQKAIRPHKRDILTLCEGEINRRPLRHLEITQWYKGREAKVYQSYITVANVPDMAFPGSEWIYGLLSNSKFPVSVSIRFKTKEYKESLDEVRKKQKDIGDQEEHTRGANYAVPLDIMESQEEAVIMEHELKNKKFPLLYTTVIVGVSARDKETLNNRVEDIKNLFKDYDIQTELPAGDQFALFNEMLPGGDQYAADYVLRLTPELLAGSMVGATKKLGDDSGFYFGVTGVLKKPTRIDPWRPSQINRSPNVSITGTLGSGKSFANDVICVNAAKLGAKLLIVDPKGDRTLWPELLPSMKGQVIVTTLTGNDEDRGKLDPFIILCSGQDDENYEERVKQAGNLAVTILQFLVGAKREDIKTRAILKAVDRMMKKDNPCMTKIVEEFGLMIEEADNEEDVLAKSTYIDIADTLKSYSNMAYASLLFGKGGEKTISVDTAINIIQIQNLLLPDAETDPENYTFEEVVGVACMYAVTSFATMFALSSREILTIYVQDEASVVTATPQGKALVKRLIRMGRAMNSPVYIISQNADDLLDEKIKNNIGMKFAFRSTDDEEVKKVLKYFGLKETQENIDVIKSLETGFALFQDIEGRTGIVYVDPVFEEYVTAFDTKPKNKQN